MTSRRPAVVASECCAARFAPNTRAGFGYCLERGFDGIECDVHLAADGEVVVQHDYRLNPRLTRDRSGRWLDAPGAPVCSLTTAQLATFDVGRYRADARELATYPRYEPRDGEPIPTLREFLSAYAARGASATLWIELKTTPFQRDISSAPDALAHAVVDAVVAAGVTARAVLLAFEWEVLALARERSADIELDYLTLNPRHVAALNRSSGAIDPYRLYGAFDPRRFGGSVPAAIAAAGGGWWGPPVGDVDANDVAQAHDRGVRVNVWNVESDAASIDAALALDADAITLSDADALVERLRSR
ncbi:MAG TPA: glycerophosphodiester phosphodiesterase family protein [Pseudomonadales bacterium]|nr:glycerophosphodiester phosphodiesterase family protein [Pseudomonadales bacterium]